MSMSDSELDAIRAAVIAELDRRQMSVSELARLSDVPQPNLSRWLAGDKTITTVTATRVMRALGLEVKRGRR
jgi:plasmid maintenance system antidote protein VapI